MTPSDLAHALRIACSDALKEAGHEELGMLAIEAADWIEGRLWVSVEDRLPESGQMVLIREDDDREEWGEHPVATYDSDDSWRLVCCMQRAYDVAYWQALPALVEPGPEKPPDPAVLAFLALHDHRDRES